MRLDLGTLALALGLALPAAGCGGGPELETRTYDLSYLEPAEAAEMVAPYIYGDRPGTPGVVSHFPGGITVRETRDNLDKIDRVLTRFDRAKPGVRLHFQVIEANGDRQTDPRIADVESALKELFRFRGYRLLAEAQMGALEGSSSTQALRQEGREYGIRADVRRIRAGQSGAVDLSVALFAERFGTVIQTSMSVPAGQTVVLGSAQPYPDQPTLILTVRPEFISAAGAGPDEALDAADTAQDPGARDPGARNPDAGNPGARVEDPAS